jgi:hypothetical protein
MLKTHVMKTTKIIFKTFIINVLFIGYNFSQTIENSNILQNNPFQLVLANYNSMNLGNKLNGFSTLLISNENQNKKANTITESEFVKNWLLYQSDIKMLPLKQFNSESNEVKDVYTNMHAFIYEGETPTMLEIINYCKK